MNSFSSDFSMYVSSDDNFDTNSPSNVFRIYVPSYISFRPAGKKKWHVALKELSLPPIIYPDEYNKMIAIECSIADLSLIEGASRPVLRRLRWKNITVFDNLQYIPVTQTYPDHITFTLQGDKNKVLQFEKEKAIYLTLNFKLR